jgi:hypothetical protein
MQIFSSAPCWQTPSGYVLPSVLEAPIQNIFVFYAIKHFREGMCGRILTYRSKKPVTLEHNWKFRITISSNCGNVFFFLIPSYSQVHLFIHAQSTVIKQQFYIYNSVNTVLYIIVDIYN